MSITVIGKDYRSTVEDDTVQDKQQLVMEKFYPQAYCIV